MRFKAPKLRMHDEGARRIVTVQIPIYGLKGEYVAAAFEDEDRAREAIEQEQIRIFAKAKVVLGAASAFL